MVKGSTQKLSGKDETAEYHKILKRKIMIYMIKIFSYVLFNFEINFLVSMQWASE
jgi:hypothetical protein